MTNSAVKATFIMTCVFMIFTLAITIIHRLLPASSSGYAISILLFAGLWLASIVIVIFFLRQSRWELREVQQKLAEELSERHHLQNQFEETIEKRTFELQRVNGALNREIAERTQAEEEVRELQKQLSLILDSAGEGILGLDNSGRVTFMNTAASLMLGWETEELLGNTHHALIHHTNPDGTPHPEEKCPIYMAYRDGKVHYKTGDIFWCKNGTSFPVEYVSTPIRDRGLLTGAVVVFRDMNTFN